MSSMADRSVPSALSRSPRVVTEHHGWACAHGIHHRVFRLPGGSRCLASVQDGQLIDLTADDGGAVPKLDVFMGPDTSEIDRGPVASLFAGQVIGRFRNPDLWEALATSIIRQVIRADQSRKLYSRFCQDYGESVSLPSGQRYFLFPEPEVVLRMSCCTYKRLGLAFKERTLRSAASSYVEHGSRWQQMTPRELLAELMTVHGVGAWTAGATVADWSNDWSFYPFADLAVRKWIGEALPSCSWPDEEAVFEGLWKSMCGEHLSALTLMTLTWSNVSSNKELI